MKKSVKAPDGKNVKSDLPAGAIPHQYIEITGDESTVVDGGVIDEVLLSIYVNVEELATIMCSPVDEEALAIGFLYNEHLINSMDDIAYLKLNASRTVADVFLQHNDFEPMRRLVITSGCGGGFATLSQQYEPLESDFYTDANTIFARMRDLRGEAHLYNAVRGVHTAVLADSEKILLAAEDVGRHNTIDKIAGKALQHNIDTRDKLLLATGRISSEMVHKARRMNIPVVISRTAPTRLAVELAMSWNICLVGYVRRNSLRVYTMPECVTYSHR